MSMWETPETPAGPAGGDDIALTTPVSAAESAAESAAAGDACPTCGGPPGPGKTGRCATCVEGEWAKLRAEMGEAWYRRHRDGEGD